MQIQVETVYSLPVLTAMARALRKTLRRKKSRRTRIFSVVLMLIALLTIVLSLTTDPSFPAIIRPIRSKNRSLTSDSCSSFCLSKIPTCVR